MGAMGSGGSGVRFRGSRFWFRRSRFWFRRSAVWFFGAALLAVTTAACAPRAAPVAASPASPPAPAATPVAAASEELPAGAGRQILMTACVSCHNLREVTKFRGYYDRQQWRDIVLTMVDYGAPVNDKDVEVLATYLTESLGKK